MTHLAFTGGNNLAGFERIVNDIFMVNELRKL